MVLNDISIKIGDGIFRRHEGDLTIEYEGESVTYYPVDELHDIGPCFKEFNKVLQEKLNKGFFPYWTIEEWEQFLGLAVFGEYKVLSPEKKHLMWSSVEKLIFPINCGLIKSNEKIILVSTTRLNLPSLHEFEKETNLTLTSFDTSSYIKYYSFESLWEEE